MSEKLVLEWVDVDHFKKFLRFTYNCGFNAGKKEIINNGDTRLVDKQHLDFAHAETVDPAIEDLLTKNG